MHINGTKFYTYDKATGLWNKNGNEDALRRIIKLHPEQLGDYYGKQTTGMDRIIKLCKSKNTVTSKRFSRFNTQFEVGEMAFTDGVYNILTAELKPFNPSTM
jgi:hypothetical protein